jgi:DNA-binding transcriptional ArsR family regulator
VTEPLQPHEVRDVEAMRVLAHPTRQRILRFLRQTGPATSTSLGKEFGENSGIMSYHLRQLAEYGFVQEVTGRGQGRERWWQVAPEPPWIPREGVSPEARAEGSGLRPMAGELEDFERFRVAREAMGEWGRGTWAVQRATLTLTRGEIAQLIAEQQALIGRYRRAAEDAPDGSRAVTFAYLVYPQPPREGA